MYRTYVTLNINASNVSLLSARRRQVERWESLPLSPGLVKDGLILNPKVVGAVINALFEAAGVPRERVIISLAGLPFTYRTISLPRMKPAAQYEAVQRAARREMQLSLEDLHLAWQAIEGGGDEQDFFVLGVPRKILDALVQTLEEAGIKPYIMDIKPLALARAAHRRDAILVDLEPERFDIVVVANGLPSLMHTVTPRGKGSFVGDNIDRIADELAKTIEFYNTGHPDRPISPATPLLLTGELSADSRARELLQNATGYAVEPLLPPFQLPPDLPGALYTANIGLALKKTSLRAAAKGDEYLFRDININLLLDACGVKAASIKQTNMLLTAVLLIAIGLMYPAYQLRGQAAAERVQLQAELTGTRQEMERRQLSISEAGPVQKDLNEVLARVERLKREQQGILNRNSEFASNLTLATDVLPAEKAYFSSVKIGRDQIIVEGAADNSFSVVNYVYALEKAGKFVEVRIAWINESTGAGTAEVETPGVSFSVIISKE